MPNVKVYVEEKILSDNREAMVATLPKLRDTIMTVFSAAQPLCHLTLVPTLGIEDQAAVLVDVHYLAKPDRTAELAEEAANQLREVIQDATGYKSDVRMISLAPEIYVALR